MSWFKRLFKKSNVYGLQEIIDGSTEPKISRQIPPPPPKGGGGICVHCRHKDLLCRRYGCPDDPNWHGDGCK